MNSPTTPTLFLQGATFDQLIDALVARLHHLRIEPPAVASSPPETSAKMLTRRDAAKELGISLSTLHNWVNKHGIVYEKLGNRTFFKRENLQAVMQPRQRTPTTQKRR